MRTVMPRIFSICACICHCYVLMVSLNSIVIQNIFRVEFSWVEWAAAASMVLCIGVLAHSTTCKWAPAHIVQASHVLVTFDSWTHKVIVARYYNGNYVGLFKCAKFLISLFRNLCGRGKCSMLFWPWIDQFIRYYRLIYMQAPLCVRWMK